MAHRGGRLRGAAPPPENSIAAFDAAVGLGYRFVETDVHTTADGVLVAFHDPGLARMTGGAGLVADLPYVELARRRIAGSQSIPRLEEILDSWPQLRINIDLKSDAAAPALATLIRKRRAWDRVCVGSFARGRLATFRRLAGPRVATSCSTAEVAAFRLGVGRWLGARATQAAQVPLRVPRHPRARVLTPSLLARVHRAGGVVHAWTINDPAEMERLLDLGVDGLISDEVEALRDVYTARNIWRSA